MSWLWVIFLLIGGVAGWVLKAVEEEDAATFLGRIAFAILALAAVRVPRELRDHLAVEWRTELQFILRKTEGKPRTRLRRGIRYALGLLISARAVADGLSGDTGRVLRMPRVARLTGAALAVAGAVWLSILSYDCLNFTTLIFAGKLPNMPAAALLPHVPAAALLPHVPAAALLPHMSAAAQPASLQLAGRTVTRLVLPIAKLTRPELMLGASYAAGVGALLCLAAWLASAWRPLVYLGGASCVTAEILHFLAGGGPLYLWVSAAIFCIVFGIAVHQLSGRPARGSASRPLPE